MTELELDWLAYDVGVQLVLSEDFNKRTATMEVIGRKRKVREFIAAAEALRPIGVNFYYHEHHTGLIAILNRFIHTIQFKLERR